VNTLKQKRLAKAANAFLNRTESLPSGDMECFFDVIAVTFHGAAYKIDWIPQAYIPIYT
jgi:Holliday junction resolvase-like predicted endonuclease